MLVPTVKDDMIRLLVSEMTFDELIATYKEGKWLYYINKEITSFPLVIQMYLLEKCPTLSSVVKVPTGYRLHYNSNVKSYFVKMGYFGTLTPSLHFTDDGYNLIYILKDKIVTEHYTKHRKMK